jgi:predicted transcriptional regulator
MKTLIEKPLNVRLPADLATQLEQLTKVTGRNKSALTIAALSRYIEVESWQIQDIQNSLLEADCGEFASSQEVSAFFAKYDC